MPYFVCNKRLFIIYISYTLTIISEKQIIIFNIRLKLQLIFLFCASTNYILFIQFLIILPYILISSIFIFSFIYTYTHIYILYT